MSTTSATSPISLTGKTCLITGGAGGLGKSIAVTFLKAGASVVICDVHEQRVQETSADLSAYGPLLALTLDITDQAAVADMFKQIAARFGTVNILVNNAAVMDRFDPVADVDQALWDNLISVNLTAPFVLSKLALQMMLQQDKPEGNIINIASGAAKAGWLAGKHTLLRLRDTRAEANSNPYNRNRNRIHSQQAWPDRPD